MRCGAIVAALAVAAACVGVGSAQTGASWTQEGVAFEQRTGWCTSHTVQNGTPAMEARPCNADFPYMSTAKLLSPDQAKTSSIPDLLESAVKYADGADNRATVLKLANDKYGGGCTMQSFKIDRTPIPGVTGFATLASFNCPNARTNPKVDYRNYATLLKQGNGALWAVAFDYPNSPMTDADVAMLRSAIGRIASAP